ncbi:hypothetical protein MKW94_020102 [Papaver nudicaule]|uniref:GMP synthase (glutamine-hydrolyzing) n=1 Tax=Papaver nudicaule TaxID=74823 RepID=A0AA41S2G5_PAPNU|nr:hypothetical protein [Papaver nudicaule]
METTTPKVLILDFGSQYTHLLTFRIRKLFIFSQCISGTSSLKTITDLNPKVIILSGGFHSEDAPTLPNGFIEYVESNGIFVLGISHGLQLLVQELGGAVDRGEKQEYETKEIEVLKESALYSGGIGSKQSVWMSHGDESVTLPEGFSVVAKSQQGSVAAIENPERRFYGLQYHPEVTDSPEGMVTLSNFLLNVCGITPDWNLEDVLEEEIRAIKRVVGDDAHVICAVSGGVDSTVAASMVYKAIGDRLHCVFVDNGLLRYKEQERVMELFGTDFRLPVTCVDAADIFLSKLQGVEDHETKREIIAKEFSSVFDNFSIEIDKKIGKKPAFLVKGTSYRPIKSSHGDGGIPMDMTLKLIEPLKLLLKTEVRELGKILNVPEVFLKRQPFPESGLACPERGLGDVTEGNALDILRQVDEIFLQSIKEAGLYDSIWQAFAIYLPVKTVGVQGDKRTHSHAVALRAVQDGMTEDRYKFERKFLVEVMGKICNSVSDVNRVLQDIKW